MTRDQSLNAVPEAVPFLSIKPIEEGGVRIAISLPTSPLKQRFLRMPSHVKREFDLDSFGHQILTWCDGKNSVADLLRLFSDQNKINAFEGEKAVLSFLRTLIGKGLVVLKIPATDAVVEKQG